MREPQSTIPEEGLGERSGGSENGEIELLPAERATWNAAE